METTTCVYGSWFYPAFCCHSRQIRASPLHVLNSQVVMGSWNTCIFLNLGRHNQPDLTFTITNQKTFGIKTRLLCWPCAFSCRSCQFSCCHSLYLPIYRSSSDLSIPVSASAVHCANFRWKSLLISCVCLAVGRLSHRKGTPENLWPGEKGLLFVLVTYDVSRVGYRECPIYFTQDFFFFSISDMDKTTKSWKCWAGCSEEFREDQSKYLL